MQFSLNVESPGMRMVNVALHDSSPHFLLVDFSICV